MESLEHKAERVKRIYEDIWLKLDHVNAVGTGSTSNNRVCIVIYLEKDDRSVRDLFPEEIEDIPLEFRIIGKAEPQPGHSPLT